MLDLLSFFDSSGHLNKIILLDPLLKEDMVQV